MSIIKCKMCGGDLRPAEGSTIAECEYCGSWQTVPSADNEKKLNLFARANRLRANNEFDKASGVYESIVADFPEEAEAYWGLILCKYGIEYVDDPATGKKIPTCHRSSFDSVMDDPNFELVMENADPIARRVYREEAKQLEELRKGIIEVSSKEEPYDIFICYKETAEDGQRTLDSVLAQDVYDMLTENGYRVFFSRVTLEDKLGQEYEPYIFAALNSAKIMLAFGTDYDYYNAVWVKNEWSRFLQLIAKGEKKTLIPCYKNIDAYDMPKEFARLQAQDMGKVGAMQDLLRGIKKILQNDRAVQRAQQSSSQLLANVFNEKAEELLHNAGILIGIGNFYGAKDVYRTVTQKYPGDYRGWWGLIISETENLQKPLRKTDEINRWFNYARKIVSSEELAKLQKLYSSYLLKIAELEAADEASNLQKKILLLNDEVASNEAIIAQLEVSINTPSDSTMGQIKIADERLTQAEEKLQKAQNSIDRDKKNTRILGWMGFILIPAGFFMVSLKSYVLAVLFLFFGVIGIGNWRVGLDQRKNYNKQLQDLEANVDFAKKNKTEIVTRYNKFTSDLQEQLRQHNQRKAQFEDEVNKQSKYLSMEAGRISYWHATLCAKIGISQPIDPVVTEYRSEIYGNAQG